MTWQTIGFNTMIKVENLCFDYPGKRALNDVSFSIAAGHITALVGPNGAGKTTLLRCLAGLDQPFCGQIYIDGIDVIENPKHAHQKIGYLSDFFGLYDDLTITQCLKYQALIHHIPSNQIEQAIQAICHELKLEKQTTKKVRELSRGLRQRLAIAQVLIGNPQIILLDEPASGLDPEARYELSQYFVKLRDRGKSLIVSSHILAELEDYCTDMIIINHGVIKGFHQTDKTYTKATLPLRFVVENLNEKLKSFLAEEENFSNIHYHDNIVTLDWRGKHQELPTLLNTFIQQGFLVSECMIEKQRFQEIYRSTTQD